MPNIIISPPTAVPLTPSGRGLGWGEVIIMGNSLSYLSPHPNLLPCGEGINPILEGYDFMSPVSSNKSVTHKIKVLSAIVIMLTGQQ